MLRVRTSYPSEGGPFDHLHWLTGGKGVSYLQKMASNGDDSYRQYRKAATGFKRRQLDEDQKSAGMSPEMMDGERRPFDCERYGEIHADENFPTSQSTCRQSRIILDITGCLPGTLLCSGP